MRISSGSSCSKRSPRTGSAMTAKRSRVKLRRRARSSSSVRTARSAKTQTWRQAACKGSGGRLAEARGMSLLCHQCNRLCSAARSRSHMLPALSEGSWQASFYRTTIRVRTTALRNSAKICRSSESGTLLQAAEHDGGADGEGLTMPLQGP